MATIKLDRPRRADDAKWLHAMAWQGGGSRLVELRGDRARHLPHGRARPRPRRLEDDGAACTPATRSSPCPSTSAEDPGIPAREVPAEPRFERAFQLDSEILRREETGGALPAGAAYGTLAVVALAWLAAIVAAVTRFGRPVPVLAAVDTLSAAN